MSKGRILTTHAGSLPRDPRLRPLFAAQSKGESVDASEMRAAIEEATAATVDRQLQAGLDLINDGEQGRESFFTYVQHRMTGFGGKSERAFMADRIEFPEFAERSVAQALAEDRVSLMAAPRAQGEIAYTDAGRAAMKEECDRLNGVLATRTGHAGAFMTAPSPGIIAAAMQNDHYPDMESYIEALARALRNEYRQAVESGFFLQIDAPDLALERHTLFHGKPLEEFLTFVRSVLAAINRALEGIRQEKVRLHVCWGNYEGPHVFDVPLADIWDEVSTARAGYYLLSMANPRHAHEYRHFRDHDLPEGATLIAGVIDTTTNYVEHPETVADRIERIADAVGDPSRIMAGTDCGFETASGFVAVSSDVVWAKLEALTEGAALASQRLF